ncbi:MAG: response regulator transcription factor [Phycisphaerales bacterium]|nr:response regulator transcription factor [Phycisphaerales bacterium]
MRVLVVEDSLRLRESLSEGLRLAGYAVDAAADGPDGLASARAVEYDLVILDIMLPGFDGTELLRRLRESVRDTPVLILSARDRLEHRVEGLRLGADDYLVKPFAFEELLARVEALCRRAHRRARNQIVVGAATLDLAGKTCSVGGRPLTLTPREYAILEFLFLNVGAVVSRTRLEEHVYAGDRQVWSNAIDSAIAAIRRKLVEFGLRDLIRTRRGSGYIVERHPEEGAA